MSEHRPHWVAEIFPIPGEAELELLAGDIRAHGLREPILRHRDGSVIDGRSRLTACRRAGVEPRFRTFEGTDAEILPLALSLNLHRRHLNESQRAMIAARIATLGKGRPSGGENGSIEPFTQEEAAERLSVSRESVKRARKVLEEGSPELVAKVDRGEIRVAKAAAATRERDAEQDGPHWTPDQLERRGLAEAGETVLANMHPGEDEALKAWARETGRLVVIDRTGPWGNPFVEGRDGDRETVVRNYRVHYLPHKPSLFEKLPELGGGKVLGCWCAPEPCHGEVLLEALRGEVAPEPGPLGLFVALRDIGRHLPDDLSYEEKEANARGLAERLGPNALRDVRDLLRHLSGLQVRLEDLARPCDGSAAAMQGLVTGPVKPDTELGPDPVALCPDLRGCLRVTLELPGEGRNGGGTYLSWLYATGDDLVSGVLLLDHKARRKGLGSQERRLRWALNEMLRRYRAAGGTGAERLGVILARTPFGKVRSGEADAPSAGPPLLELTAEPSAVTGR